MDMETGKGAVCGKHQTTRLFHHQKSEIIYSHKELACILCNQTYLAISQHISAGLHLSRPFLKVAG